MPAQTESNFFIRGAAQFETDCGRNAIGMGYYLIDMNSHIMSRIGISPDASFFHNRRDVEVTQETILAGSKTKDTDRFPEGNR